MAVVLCDGGIAWWRGGSWSGWLVARFQRTQRHLQEISLAAFNLQFIQAGLHGTVALREVVPVREAGGVTFVF